MKLKTGRREAPWPGRATALLGIGAMMGLVACGGGGAEEVEPAATPQTAQVVAATVSEPPEDDTEAFLAQDSALDEMVDAFHHPVLPRSGLQPLDVACTPWSSPALWGGSLPAAGDTVDIPSGQCVLLDLDPPELGGLVVRGTLRFQDDGDRTLNAAWVHVQGGALEIGSPNQPFQHRATLTLTDTQTGHHAVPGMGTRGLFVSNGRLSLHGWRPQRVWTRINAHADAGATQLQLAKPVADWRAGDEVVVAPTDYYGVAVTERRSLASVSAKGWKLRLTAGLDAPRWGMLQYVDPASPQGLSLEPSTQAPTSSPSVLDQRAEVGHLTRGIVIQAPDDPLWQEQGFGAQTMIMGQGSQVQVDGVHFRRVGQAGRQGRYPFHWHMLSYQGGQPVGDVQGHSLRRSVISGSRNRCVVIHGTNGVEVSRNICHDIRGHAIFLEDAVERRNLIQDNLVLQVRNPLPGTAFLDHDVLGATSSRGGPSGMWLTHPDNVVRRNVVADVQGPGYWLAFPDTAIGHPDSLNPAMRPRHTPFGVFNDNVAHSVNLAGVQFDEPPVSTPPHSATVGALYQPTVQQLPQSETNPIVPFVMRRNVTYKNREGLWNRVNGATYRGWISADNTSKFFIGSTAVSFIRNSLVVGTSLNQATTWQTLATSAMPAAVAFRAHSAVEPPAAFASYHGGVAMRKNTVVNFPYVDSGQLTAFGSAPSGAFAFDDYYLRPVERSLEQNAANRLIASVPGRRSVASAPTFRLAGAVYDPEGLWGPAGRYWVYDQTFFTHGGACRQVQPAGVNGRSCVGPYFGAEAFVLDRNNDPFYPLMALEVTRRDPGNVQNVLGTWGIEAVAPAQAAGTLLPNMRHVAMRQGGVYVMGFPGYRGAPTVPNARGPLTDVRMTMSNLHGADDHLILAVEHHGAQAHVLSTTWGSLASNPLQGALSDQALAQLGPATTRRFVPRASLAELLSTPGDAYVHHPPTTGPYVWVRVHGGLSPPWTPAGGFAPFDDQTLYRPFFLRVYGD